LIVEDAQRGTCLELGEAVVDASMVDSAEITEGLHGPVVAIELDPTGAEALDELAATYLRGDAAVVSNGELLSVVRINAPDLPDVIELGDLGEQRARNLVSALGGDGDATIPSDPQLEQQRLAERLCDAYRPPAGSELEVVGFGPTTMGEQNDLLHRMGQSTVDPLPGTSADTPIALCSYRLSPDVVPSTPPSTTICPDGSILDMTAPLQYLVAENGSAIEDPQDHSVLGGPVCG
jgi:hypothetical protein